MVHREGSPRHCHLIPLGIFQENSTGCALHTKVSASWSSPLSTPICLPQGNLSSAEMQFCCTRTTQSLLKAYNLLTNRACKELLNLLRYSRALSLGLDSGKYGKDSSFDNPP